jgi:hypothetical protein
LVPAYFNFVRIFSKGSILEGYRSPSFETLHVAVCNNVSLSIFQTLLSGCPFLYDQGRRELERGGERLELETERKEGNGGEWGFGDVKRQDSGF